MIVGFSGFGFPKAHGAAFGLLAYQSTWLRVHYGPEFLCALLNEQPMGFYASDTLVHEAQRRGIALLAADVNASAVELHDRRRGASGIGLGYVSGVRADEVAALVAAREEGGPFRSLGDLASRAGAGRPALDQLAWAGACDSLAARADRVTRAARRCGSSGSPRPASRCRRARSSRCRSTCPAAPELRALEPWESMIADYATTGLTLGRAPDGAAARRRCRPARVSDRDLETLRARRRAVRIGGLVVARQRPGTAKGIVFLLLEDEFGTINLIVPPTGLRAPPPDSCAPSRCCSRAAGSRSCRSPAARSTSSSSAAPLLAPRRARVVEAERRRRRGRRARGARAAAAGGGAADGATGRLPHRRARGPELRLGPAAVTRLARDVRPRRASLYASARCPLVFVLVCVLLGLGVLFVAMSGGAGRRAARGCSRRAAAPGGSRWSTSSSRW